MTSMFLRGKSTDANIANFMWKTRMEMNTV